MQDDYNDKSLLQCYAIGVHAVGEVIGTIGGSESLPFVLTIPSTDWRVHLAELSRNKEYFTRLTSKPAVSGELVAADVWGLPILPMQYSRHQLNEAMIKLSQDAQTFNLLSHHTSSSGEAKVVPNPVHYLQEIMTSLTYDVVSGTQALTNKVVEVLLAAQHLLSVLSEHYPYLALVGGQRNAAELLTNSRKQDQLSNYHRFLHTLALQNSAKGGPSNELLHRFFVILTEKIYVRSVGSQDKEQKLMLAKDQPEFKVDRFATALLKETLPLLSTLAIQRVLRTFNGACSLTDVTSVTETLQCVNVSVQSRQLLQVLHAFGVTDAVFAHFVTSRLPNAVARIVADFVEDEWVPAILLTYLQYAFHKSLLIPNLEGMVKPYADRLRDVVPRPDIPLLADKLAEAKAEYAYYATKSDMLTKMEYVKNDIGVLNKSIGELERKMAVALSKCKPPQNCITDICLACGDAFPLHKEFMYDARISGVSSGKCSLCHVIGIDRCDECLRISQLPTHCVKHLRFRGDCDGCKAAASLVVRCADCIRLIEAKVASRVDARKGSTYHVRVGVPLRGRWNSWDCTRCKFKYYTQVGKPKTEDAMCAYCVAGIPVAEHPYKDTALFAEVLDLKQLPLDYTETKQKLEPLLLQRATFEAELQTKMREFERFVGADDGSTSVEGQTKCTWCQDATVVLGNNWCECCITAAKQEAELAQRTEAEMSFVARPDAKEPPVYVRAILEEKIVNRLWIDVPKRATDSLLFENIAPWNDEMLTGKGEKKLLDMYMKLGVKANMDPIGQKFVFAARDRPECSSCPSCLSRGDAVCSHYWFPAYLIIRNVTHEGQSDRLIIVVFPGYPPAQENQVLENELYAKKLQNCPHIANDVNLRVFLMSSEMHKLIGNVGTIVR